MKSRLQAIVITVTMALLGMIIPPIAYLSSAVVGLVGLRLGPTPAIGLVVLSAIAISLTSLLLFGTAVPGLATAVMLWLPILIVAETLRRSADQGRAYQMATGLGIFALALLNLLVGDEHWKAMLEQTFEQAGVVGMEAGLQQLLPLMNGVMAAGLTFSVLLGLVLARWWQSMLYNPGGFREEFHALRMPVWMGWMTLVVYLVSFVGGSSSEGALAGNLALILTIVFMMQGLAVVHGMVGQQRLSEYWLYGVYGLSVFMLPQMVLIMALVGLTDNRFDFRSQPQQGGGAQD